MTERVTTGPETTSQAETPLATGTLIGWGIGSAGATIMFAPYVNLFLRFMTDYLAISAGVAGLIVGGARIVDAASDLAIGTISDRSRSRWGRRRPYLLAGGVMTSLCLIALFAVPGGMSGGAAAVYLFAMVVMFSVGFALWYVPYLAMTSEMTNSHSGRAVLVSYRIVGSSIGSLLGGAGTAYLLVLFGGGRFGYAAMGATIGTLGLIFMLSCVYLSRNAPTTTRHAGSPYTLRQQATLMLQNRPFFLLIVMKIFFFTGMASFYVSLAFFVKYVFRLSDAWLGTFFLILTASMLLSVPGSLWVSKRVERRTMAIGALLLNALATFSYLFAYAGEPTWLMAARFALVGISNSAITLMTFAMLADTMEYDYLNTGLRREGLFAGFVMLVEKSANAIGIAGVGLILSQMGYVASQGGAAVAQSRGAINGIYTGFSLLPGLLTVAAALTLIGYHLTRARLDEMRRDGPPDLTALAPPA